MAEWTVTITCSVLLAGETRAHALNLEQHKFKVLEQITSLHIQLSTGTEQGTAEST